MSKNLPPPPAPIEPPTLTPLEEAQRLIGKPLTPALVEALEMLIDDWHDKLALRNHAPGMPLVMIKRDLLAISSGCTCKAYKFNRRQYAGQLDKAGNP
jgi:hypothetical protein